MPVQNVPILMYHSIAGHATPQFRPYVIPLVQFEAQMAHLQQAGYTALTVTQFVQAGAALPDKPVLVTFDDGFGDFYTTALPILQKYDITVTLYIVTSAIGATAHWLAKAGEDHRAIVTWEQILAIRDSGIEIGAHTHTHPHLDIIPRAKAREEIASCKHILEDRLGQPVYSFAYPYGYYTGRVKGLVRQAGYTSACAVNLAMTSTKTNRLALDRLIITPDMSLEDFDQVLNYRNKPLQQANHWLRAKVWWFMRLTRGIS